MSLFPYDEVRPEQDKLMSAIGRCIREGRDCLIHAPTGLGKTAASLVPALTYARSAGKLVFFLTSRHTQHRIAVDTLAEIKKKHGEEIVVADIIGKQGMCVQEGADHFLSREFSDYCRTVREEGSCKFYVNSRKNGSLSPKAQLMVERVRKDGPFHADPVIAECREKELCPYEVMVASAAEADVVVADYYYVFNQGILDLFLGRIGKSLSDCILIVDEGHNLGSRVRDLSTARLSDFMISRALSEAKKEGEQENVGAILAALSGMLNRAGMKSGEEMIYPKSDLIGELEVVGRYDAQIKALLESGERVKKKQKRSSLSSIAMFLERWIGPEDGFARILSCGPKSRVLSYRCLDPSLYAGEIIRGAHATVLMSGTLVPLEMYRDILGFAEDAQCFEFMSPFPKKNRLNMIIPRTTTKYAQRNDAQYRMISGILAGITNAVPGNVAVFFPSYGVRDRVLESYQDLSEKTMLKEVPNLRKEEKQDLIESFKSYSKVGSVLTCVASGSFGEGVDLPGDLLKGVVVVGLPLQVPDLETKELILYYDKKFKKGWDYGYILPAITKSLQNAGRCIRSESDKGVIVFLEERFAWERYRRCFPTDWNIEITLDFQNHIKEFFSS